MAKEKGDDSTAFEVLAPDPSRLCRIVRRRRYRPVRNVGQRAKKAQPFDGETCTMEITECPLGHDVSTGIAVAVAVTISGAVTSTYSKRQYGSFHGGRGVAFSFCPFGGRPGHGFWPFGSIRGGATSEEEEEDTDAEVSEFDPSAYNDNDLDLGVFLGEDVSSCIEKVCWS